MREFYMSRSDQGRWFIRLAGKWVLLILGITLYTLIVARASYAKAERVFDGWKEEYAAGYIAHMQTVEETMPMDAEKMEHIEMMQEFWRRHK